MKLKFVSSQLRNRSWKILVENSLLAKVVSVYYNRERKDDKIREA